MAQPGIPVDLIITKLAQDAEKVGKRAQKAADVMLGALNTELGPTPYRIVYEEDRVRLKHYSPAGGAQLNHPLLVVYAQINRETMLDLQPGRSVVQNFLEGGVEVYMIDWGYPTQMDKFLTIDDHVNGYMNNIVDFILDRHQISQLHLMGICMGGTFSVIYSALHPQKVKNLVTTVTPTNFDTDQGLLHIWMKAIDVDRMVDSFGNIPADLMNFAFLLLNPARLMIDKYVGFFENMDNRDFVENFIRMEKWIFDSPDITGETFRQFVKDCYQKNLLINSQMEVGGQRVELKKITMPLLNFYGKFDHLVPPAACELLSQRVGSKDTEDICLDTGHIGIYVSSKCQRAFSPKIIEWLKARDQLAGRPRRVAARSTARTAAASGGKRKAAAAVKTKKV
ncbi:MAG: class III poly(R)-hydroxyalkanoic acid synthase subunit PhaC [Desulfobacteraceae bacterium]|nr:class III poly(R)-hydroxyalkanoic acid synthase subunit PhaC [Desulfobacteraceae bacterium]